MEDTKFPSPTTPGFYHKTAAQFATEQILINNRRRELSDDTFLPQPRFWTVAPYKGQYGRIITVVRRTMKLVGEAAVIRAVASEKVCWPTYASLLAISRKFLEQSQIESATVLLESLESLKPLVNKPIVQQFKSFSDLME